MSGVELHRAERVVTTVAFEAVQQLDARYKERFRMGLAEYTEEWHVGATGFVAGGADFVSADAEIEFSMDFFAVTEQRRSDLIMPTFHFGSYQAFSEDPDTSLVVITAAVREWTMRDDDAFIGATVTVGAFLPNATGPTNFDATVHLSFSGWGAPWDPETSSENDVGDD